MADVQEIERFLAEQKRKCDRLLEEGLSTLGDVSMVAETGLFGGTDWSRLKGDRNLAAESNVTLEESDRIKVDRCPPFFDGLLCWSRVDAPGVAILPCPPATIMGHSNVSNDNVKPLAVASKVCLASGEWYRNLDGVSWSNYTLCEPNNAFYVVDSADELKYPHDPAESLLLTKLLPIIRTVSQIGYITSFTTLIVAMVVFALLRKLRNPRNRLHMHLFASFIMRAFMALLKDWLFIDGIGLAWDIVIVDGKNAFIEESNTWVCKIITSLWQFFIVANYSWILMEGLYLHNLIFLALCTDTGTITRYVLLGWGFPLLIVVPWIVLRAIIEDTLCWTTHENSSLFLVIRIPIMISILFNFVLFLNIVRVLLVKLKTSGHLQRKKMRYKRWAKSTLVLVPLFGAHYTFFLGLSYHKDYHVELVWLFCDQLFASFQGAFVALLYCLLNDEVRAEIRRTWRARRSKRDVDSLILGHRESTKVSRNRTVRVQQRSEGDGGANLATDTVMRELSVAMRQEA